MTSSETRAERLVHWYPRAWRDRYGEEFAELLSAEIEEQPQSWRRGLDVRVHGAKARLSAIGIGAGPIRDHSAIRAVHAFTLTVFIASTTSLWGQVLNGGSSAPWAHPAVAATRVVLAATFGLLAIWMLVGGCLLARRTAPLLRSHRRLLAAPLLTIGIGATLFVGGSHVAWSNSHEGITATSVSRMLTQSINAYWGHPHLLVHSYDGDTRTWILLSPIAVTLVVAGVVKLVGAVEEITPAGCCRQAPGWVRPLLVTPAFAVSAWWVITSQHYGSPILRAGTLDLAQIAAMAIALVVLTTTRDLAQKHA